MSKIGERLAVVFIVFFMSGARSEPPTSPAQLSPIERQQADFYGAIVGPDRGITIEWIAPKSVRVDEEFELVLRVKNAVNPAELTRPDLAARPDWQERFQSFADAAASAPGEFRYRLKPRNSGTCELPLPKYRVYHARLPEGRRFQTLFQEPVTLIISDAAPVGTPPDKIPILIPERFRQPVPETDRFSTAPPMWLWMLAIGAAILIPVCWIPIWRIRHPDEAKLARFRRAASVRNALDALAKSERKGEPAVIPILLDYLRLRHHTPPGATMPLELAVALRLQNQSEESIAELETLLRTCDAARFGPDPNRGRHLARAARELILRWESASE